MNDDAILCDMRRIEGYLSGRLSDQEQEALESHLDVCEECRGRISDAAAEKNWWNDARHYLSGEWQGWTDSGTPVGTGEARPVREQIAVTFLNPTDDPRMLGRFAGYEVAGVIGQGGMGIVLKGFDPALNRYVAIKVLAPHLATSGAARKRFAREAQAAAAVVHDNVVAIHGVDEANGLPFLVMPYVRGTSLQKRIDASGPLAVTEILRIGLQTAEGLAAAHAQGLVHRDIKPANILLPEGVARVLITDFGLARAADDASLTHSGVVAGTPQFMSPEQARGEAVDARSDLFSLGSVMYAMCTGRPPFRAETTLAILRRITDVDPRPIREINPEIPGWLCRIVGRLHAKSCEDRYATATEAAAILRACLAHVQDPTNPLPEELQEERCARWRRRSVAAAAAGTGAVLLIAIAILASSGDSPSTRAPQTKTHSAKVAETSPVADAPLETDAAEVGAIETADATDAAPPPGAPPKDVQWNAGIDDELDALEDQIHQLSTESETPW